MAATLTIPFDERLSIGEQVRWVRQRRLRRAAIKRVGITTAVMLTVAAALLLLWRPSDPGWSTTSSGGAPVTISEASNAGARFTGHGLSDVTTPTLFESGQNVAIFGGGEPRFVTADNDGRIHFTVDLTGDRSYSYPVSGGGSTEYEAFVSFLVVPGGANRG